MVLEGRTGKLLLDRHTNHDASGRGVAEIVVVCADGNVYGVGDRDDPALSSTDPKGLIGQ